MGTEGWTDLPARLAAVRREITAAAGRVGRDAGTIRLIGVTKTLPPDAVRAALAAGLEDLGENYVQEARTKRDAVAGRGTWHLIGGLQRNKVRAAVAVFDRVHTVDSADLAAALAAAAARAARVLPVLLQVNPAGEPTKRGVPLEGIEPLARAVLRHPALRLEGLMTLPPPGQGRPHFRTLREARDAVADRLGVELPHLSMGMSDDYPVAVEEGATFVRIGRALFGARGLETPRPGS